MLGYTLIFNLLQNQGGGYRFDCIIFMCLLRQNFYLYESILKIFFKLTAGAPHVITNYVLILSRSNQVDFELNLIMYI